MKIPAKLHSNYLTALRPVLHASKYDAEGFLIYYNYLKAFRPFNTFSNTKPSGFVIKYFQGLTALTIWNINPFASSPILILPAPGFS